jgi:hypothetical protein
VDLCHFGYAIGIEVFQRFENFVCERPVSQRPLSLVVCTNPVFVAMVVCNAVCTCIFM